MKRPWVILVFAILILMSACRPSEPAAMPTLAPTIAGPPLRADAVSLITLARYPATFKDGYLQVSGEYQSRPLLVCGDETHRSPATWTLNAGEIEIPAGGFDGALRSLASDGLSLVVEGRWQRWQGPVGCGRRPPAQDIYYLEVSRIVSPNPLLPPPPAGGEEVAEVTTPIPATPEEDPATGLTATAVFSTTPTFTPSPTQTLPADTTPLPSPTGTGTPGITETPRATATSPTATATATVDATASVTPSPTATTDQTATAEPTGTPVSVGSMSFDATSNLVKRSIGAGELQQWQFVGASDDVATISLAASPDLNASVEVVGPNGARLALVDQSGQGGIETVSQLALQSTGTYLIRVRAVGGSSGAYAVVLLNSFSEPFFVFQSNISYSGTGSGSLPTSVDHLYGFVGASGDRITISVDGSGDSDMVLYLIGPDGSELIFVDDNGAGAIEALNGFQLPTSGYYSIGVGEADFEPASYSMTLARGS